MDAASVIAEKLMPSVVGISTVSTEYRQSIFGTQQGTVQGSGTGFIVDENGYILTNSHVVDNGNSSQITVDLYDGSEYPGTVLWSDSSLDLAIVKIDAKNLQAVELGDSDDVQIGDYAVAIGNPLGRDFERSVNPVLSAVSTGRLLRRTVKAPIRCRGFFRRTPPSIPGTAAVL